MDKFDQSNISEAIASIETAQLEPIVKRAADAFYATVMETAEDYLRDNLDYNLKSHLDMLERENQRMRTELYEIDCLVGRIGQGQKARLEAIATMDRQAVAGILAGAI